MGMRNGKIFVIVILAILGSACSPVDTSPVSSTYAISGVILDSNGLPLQEVIVTATGSNHASSSVSTDQQGKFTFSGLNGTTTIAPQFTGYSFQPEIEVRTTSDNQVDFIGYPQDKGEPSTKGYTVTGQVLSLDKVPLEGVEILAKGEGTTSQLIVTDSNGRYMLGNLQGTVTISPLSPEVTFQPASYSVTDSQEGIDFVGIANESNDEPDKIQTGQVFALSTKETISLTGMQPGKHGYLVVFPTANSGSQYAFSLNGGASISPEPNLTLSQSEEALFDLENRQKEQELVARHSLMTPRALALSKRVWSVGDKRQLNILTRTIAATLRVQGEQVNIWVADTIDLADHVLAEIRDEYENNIAPTVTHYFGEQPNSRDFPVLSGGDQRLNIVFAPMHYGGFFYSADLYPKDFITTSNEGKFIYINPNSSLSTIKSTVTHEFQHLIFFSEKVKATRLPSIADIWINEGFSLLAEDLVGYGYASRLYSNEHFVSQALQNINGVSLILWNGTYADYGMSYLFARYLWDRFGSGIIGAVTQSNQAPQDALASYSGISFRQLFADWGLSLALQGSVSDSKYTFGVDVPSPRTQTLKADGLADKVITWGLSVIQVESAVQRDLVIELLDSASGEFMGVWYP